MMKPVTTKDKIFKEAAFLFSENGFERTTMQKIAERVQISKPAIYYHFPNKQDLFEALIASAMEQARLRLESIAVSDKDPVQKLKDFVVSRFRDCKNHPERSRFLYDVATGSLRKKISLDHVKMFADQSRNLSNIIKEGKKKKLFRKDLDFDEFAFLFIGSMNMYVMSYIKGYIKDLNEQKAHRLVNLLISGIRYSQLDDMTTNIQIDKESNDDIF
jgi:AcrR family transcriptional regulator